MAVWLCTALLNSDIAIPSLMSFDKGHMFILCAKMFLVVLYFIM